MTAKNNGVYYTPKSLASFMIQHAIQAFSKTHRLSILEPSCGDGIFIEAFADHLTKSSEKLHSIDCVELDGTAIKSAKKRSAKSFTATSFYNEDFFQFADGNREKYDFIIGNPPYVVRKRLPEQTINRCKNVYEAAGLTDQYFRNLWGAFLVSATELLTSTGVIAFVLPAELLQVKFTSELRGFLLKKFDRLEIVSFKDIIFKDIEQDTVLLFGYKNHAKKRVVFCGYEKR